MKPIIVLGMHRSGTSAITRAIGLLGAAMGDARRMRKHWENLPLRKVNERLITIGQGTWDAPPEPGWWDTARARKQLVTARTTVQEQFGSERVAVWKDPRTCLTLPFWLEVFDESPVFLFIHRHPTEVADSLTSRNELGRGHGYAIWERYNADALRYAQGHPTVVLGYDRLVAEPVESLAEVCDAFSSFGVPLPHDPATTDHGLVAQARHHTAGSADTIEGGLATPSQHEILALLRTLDGAHEQLRVPRPVPDPHPLSLELFDLIRRGRQANKAQHRSRLREEDDPDADGYDDEVDHPGQRVRPGRATGTAAVPGAARSGKGGSAQRGQGGTASRRTGRKTPTGTPPGAAVVAPRADVTPAGDAAASTATDVAARRARRQERRKNVERRASRRAAAAEPARAAPARSSAPAS